MAPLNLPAHNDNIATRRSLKWPPHYTERRNRLREILAACYSGLFFQAKNVRVYWLRNQSVTMRAFRSDANIRQGCPKDLLSSRHHGEPIEGSSWAPWYHTIVRFVRFQVEHHLGPRWCRERVVSRAPDWWGICSPAIRLLTGIFISWKTYKECSSREKSSRKEVGFFYQLTHLLSNVSIGCNRFVFTSVSLY